MGIRETLGWAITAADWAWTWPFPLAILILGIYYLFITRAVVFRRLGYIIGDVLRQVLTRPQGKGNISPFRAFTISLGTMVGLGNVAGVATAITMGGPGAIFWMWVMGLCAATLNYAEVVLGITFRVKSPVLGEYVCTRSHVYEGGIRWRSLGRGLALISALMVLLPPVSYLTQTQAVAGALALAMDWPQSLVALVIAVTIMLVVVGELKSIAATSEVLVTLMVAAYLGVGWWALAASGSVLKPALLSIFKHAFSPAAASGGFAGATVRQALRYGLARGAFSCNAATGSAMTTHAAAVVDHPARQGIWGVVEVFLDTLVLCSTTGLVILASGTWTSGVTAGELVALSFDYFFPGFGGKFAALCALAFGWTTMLGMYYATTKNFTYLLGAGSRWLFPALYYYRAAIFFTMLVAPRIHVDIIWALQDLFTALSVAVNLGAMFLLGSVVAKKTREFFG